MANKPYDQHEYQSGRVTRAGAPQTAQPIEPAAPDVFRYLDEGPQTTPPPAPRPEGSSGVPPVAPEPEQTPGPKQPDVFGYVDATPPPAKPFKAAAKPKKNSHKKVVLISVCLVVALLGGLFAAGLGYLDGVFDTGLLGFVSDKNYVPKNYRKSEVANFLIVGIDNEEGRDYGAGLGMADMILYANYDVKNNKLNLLQIPRDSYVGEQNTGGTGKINAVLMNGPDKQNPINNLVAVVEQQFQLPVDHYVALDMDGMKSIVDTLGGIRVYVSQDMGVPGGSYLPQGWRWLDGNAAEFFVRNRSGPGFDRADLDRLDNQRHFYSALFRRLMNLAPQDIVNLLPIFDHYCSTDLPLRDIFDLCFTALNLQPEAVLFCKAPGATGPELDPSGQGRSLYIVDKYGRGTEQDPGTATLLNLYFRTYGAPVPAEQLGLPDIHIPESYALYSPNVQMMTDVQAPEGGAEVDVEP